MKKKTPLVIDTENGITTDAEKQAEIVTLFFEDMFNSAEDEKIEDITPTKMKARFTEEEVRKAIECLKNNKSPGIDELQAEHLKCGPGIVHHKIADLLNHIAETGDFPKEIKTGILIPLQKPGKKRGPPSNLRPVILLSILRKILAICLIRRIGKKIDNNIPLSQAAYRAGRGTTEQLLTIKLLAEKAVTTPKYETHLLMMDMSKAFDRVRRQTVIEDLKTILDPDELHLIKILIEDVRLVVKIDGKLGKEFKTNIGTPQGDCLSPILFTLYLANALKGREESDQIEVERREEKSSQEERTNEREERSEVGEHERRERRPEEKENHPDLAPHMQDHCYSKQMRTGQLIPLQYADDICWLAINCTHTIDNIKREIPEKLAERNLLINEAKTEEYKIVKEGTTEWMRCKYLGTLLETTEDIKSRKRNANEAMRKIQDITRDRNISIEMKLRAFNAYVTSIFLYNSETWTVTKGIALKIDSYHRRLLRTTINVIYPKKISSISLMDITKEKPWSEVIKQRRLRLLGHVLRLPTETPIRIALEEYKRPLKMARGAPKLTWGKNIEQDLQSIGIDYPKAQLVSQNRKEWQKLIA